MTNKDYKRLTDTGIPTITPDDVYNRLYELENTIENGTLVFLPCKVGDDFWCVDDVYPKGYEGEVGYFQVYKKEVFIVDVFGLVFPIDCLYFTWKAAKKALEEMKKC